LIKTSLRSSHRLNIELLATEWNRRIIVIKVKLTDIIEAIESTDQNSEYFLDRENGEIVYINTMAMDPTEQEQICEQLDEHGFYRLPTSYDIDDYGIMENFSSQHSGIQADRLFDAINGRGAFSRFKREVRSLGIEQEWYAFRDAAYKQKAIEWCEENDLEWQE